jgi:integrase
LKKTSKTQSSPGHQVNKKPLPKRFYKSLKKFVPKNVSNTMPVLRDHGGIIHPDKPWYIEYYYDGHRIREKFGINYQKDKKKRYALAELYRKNLEIILQQGFNPFEPLAMEPEVVEDKKRIAAELPKIIEYKKQIIAHRTWQSYNSSVNRFIKFCNIGNIIYLNDLDKDVMLKYEYYLATEMGNSAKSRGNEIGNLSAVFNVLIEKKLMNANPCNGIKRTKKSSGATQVPWTKQEYQILKEVTYNKHFSIWIYANFSFFCGLRPKETGLIKRKDIDIENQILLVNIENSKTKHTDAVVIPNLFIEDLRKYCENIPEEYYLFSKGFAPGESSVHRNLHQQIIKKVVYDGGKIKKKVYQLKHTAAVLMKKSKYETQLIQSHFRHTSSSTTEIYLSGLKNHIYQEIKTNFPDINAF